MSRALLADFILIVHASIVAFIVLGEIGILIGWWRKWDWARNPWLRWSHLGAIILVVLLGAVIGYCPLTEWEYAVRESIGQAPEQGSFVGRFLHRILFIDLPEWVFLPAYAAFAAVVVATMVGYPPRRKKKQQMGKRT